MNWVDLVIILCAAGTAAFGVVRGGTVQLMSYVGFAAGLLLGAAIAPAFADAVDDTTATTMIGLVLPFTLGILLSAGGRKVGAQMARRFRSESMRQADKAGGAVFGVVVTLVGAWLLAGMLGPIGLPGVSPAINESAIARGLGAALPPAPLALARVQEIVVPTGIPPMLAELEPSPAPDVAIASAEQLDAAVSRAKAGTVQIVARGCGRTAKGSGFVAADGLVVTNAHVVAGVDRPSIEDRRGSHAARIVLFDPDTDLAVLRASRLAGKPLPLLRTPVGRGQPGAVIGYPLGGPFHSEPSAVLAAFEGLAGRDIYGSRERVTRQVYQLKGRIRNGNSGGPFVTPGGEVAGVIFSTSAINQNIGYALTSAGVAPLVDRARNLTAAVDAGPCPTDE